jgi:uncharacterized membrane protein
MRENALQRARRQWGIQAYLAEAQADRRRGARRAGALFVVGAVLAQIAACFMTDGAHFLGFTVVALGLLSGAAIVLRETTWR